MFISLLLLALCSSTSSRTLPKATVPQQLALYDYPCEEHFVTTYDGYILRMQRIPHGKNGNRTHSTPVFLLQGLFSSSIDWLVKGPGEALGYLLADAGYDVWLGNTRGTTYSRNHTFLNPDNSSVYWSFSWHEMGIFDLPAMIDFILEKTGQEKLYHVGHSQGNTAFFVMCSLLHDYNNKIAASFSLAPIAFLKDVISLPLRYISMWEGPLGDLLELLGVDEFLPNTKLLRLSDQNFCGEHDLTLPICYNVEFLICGFNPKEQNVTLLPLIEQNSPAGASTKEVLHYAQGVNSGKFRAYDYGVIGNLQKYGLTSPPDYPLHFVTAPVHLFYSDNDWLSSVKSVNMLAEKLPNMKMKYKVGHQFNHLDYMFAIHARQVVYEPLMRIIDELERNSSKV